MSILITRPEPLASALAQFLNKNHGFHCICFPVIATPPPRVVLSVTACRQALEKSQLVVFMSPMSVILFLQHYSPGMLNSSRVIAMGKGSAEQLLKQNIPVEAYPQPANSQALLKLDALQSASLQNVCIVSGEQSNPLLADTLTQRGINVQHCYTHQRQPKQYDAIPWTTDQVELTVCTSNLSLQYFNTLIHTHHLQSVKTKPLLVITQRMQERAEALGFTSVSLAAGAHQEQLLDAIMEIV